MSSEISTDVAAKNGLRVQRRRLWAVVALFGVVGACGLILRNVEYDGGFGDGEVVVDNRTGERIRVIYVLDDGPVELADVAVSGEVELDLDDRKRGCTIAPLRAETVDGRRVAMRVDPICVNDTWIVREKDLRPRP